jgi:hypothetical protein
VRWSGAPLILMLVSLAQLIVCQEQQAPFGYEQQSKLWLSIKRELIGPRGEQYFEQSLKDANIPGGANGLHAFEGILVSSTPTQHPNEFLVAMPGEKTPEVTLKLKGQLDKPLPAGTPVSFEGVVKAFAREPFMLILDVETVNRAVRPGDPPTRNKKSK